MNRSIGWKSAGVLVALLAAVQTASAQREVGERVEITRDIAYADNDNPRQMLDLFLPRDRRDDKPLPVIAFIHGGAWQGGDRRGGAGQLARFVASGDYAGVSIGYRLSGEAQWPAQIHDCKAAIRWIRAHAKEHNLHPDKIGVWGTSAGGHLVACLGTMGDVKELEGDLGKHVDQSSRVACVVDFFGPSDFLTIGDQASKLDHYAANSPESRLIGAPILEHKDKAKAASPLYFVTKDDAPHLIVHSDKDETVPYQQSEVLHQALRAAEVPSILIKMKGAGHGFGGEELSRRVSQFFGKHLRGEEAEVSGEAIGP